MPLYNILFRRDTTANWEAANPILLDGEVGYERTADGLMLIKMGDGVMDADGVITGTHWNDLPYCSGPVGSCPEHEWEETSVKFKNPDGTWGKAVNLKGAKGDTGDRGPQGIPGKNGQDGKDGEPGTASPATPTTLGGVMVSTGLTADAEGRLSVCLPWKETDCYNSPIVVTHNNKLYFWLQASGVGLKAGVREPGTDNGAAYWAQVPLLSELQAVQATANAANAATGVTAGAYGPTANVKPAHGAVFNVPYFKVDARGKVLEAATRTVTLPTVPAVTNATTATKLATARTITVKLTTSGSGNSKTMNTNTPQGSASFDGTKNITIDVPLWKLEYNCECSSAS